MVHDKDPSGGNPFQRLLNSIRSGRVPLPLLGGFAATLIIGVIIVTVATGSNNNEPRDDTGLTTPDTTTTATPVSGGLQTARPEVEATADLTQPTAEAENLTEIAVGDKLVIPAIGVDAPLTYRRVGGDGVMPDPDGPDDIAYYDFSEWPGKGGAGGVGNINLAGHVDSGSVDCKDGTVPAPCEAVLWDLHTLRVGDELHVHLGDTRYIYTVTSNEPVNAFTGPWDQIVASTAEPSLTLITCGGDFNRETGEYTDRQVLKAVFQGQEPI